MLPLAGPVQAQQPNVTLICKLANETAIHIEIIGDGSAIAIKDRIAQTMDLYLAENVPQQMIERFVDDHLQSDVYQCTVVYGSAGRGN